MHAGDVLDDRYTIERVIGEGTFAWVYLARHTTISSLQCAIKVLKPHFSGDEELRGQFRHEAETVARLRNRHTVRVSDMGELPDGRPYICMEYCIGATLDQLLIRHGPQPSKMVAHVARGALHSLREAHDLGIVHRDIKPSNISLTEDPTSQLPLTRVLDFGIAYVAQVQKDADDSDLVFCTPSYAAPEILRGDIGPGADIYALGLTMAELLEGEPVFPNTGFYTVAARQLANEPVPFGPRARASALLPILQRACDKDATTRYQNTDEMLADLDEIWDSLDEVDTLTWQHFAPPNCVGTDRCMLAAARLDMALPAGCTHSTCGMLMAPVNELHTPNGAPPHLNPDKLKAMLAGSGSVEFDVDDFHASEFSDTHQAPLEEETTLRDPELARRLRSERATRPLDTDTHQQRETGIFPTGSGTARAHKLPLGDHGPGTQRIPRQSAAPTQPHAQITAPETDALAPTGASATNPEASWRTLFRDAAPVSGEWRQPALLIARVALLIAVIAAMIALLFSGLPA